MFAIPLIANIGLGLSQQRNFGISTGQAFIILFVAFVFAYGSNTVSLKAIDKTPNPGYSLVLSKSYVLFTTIVAVLLLDAELTARKAMAIALIVGFSVLIMVNGRTKKMNQTTGFCFLLAHSLPGVCCPYHQNTCLYTALIQLLS